jgi:biotin operon repressor
MKLSKAELTTKVQKYLTDCNNPKSAEAIATEFNVKINRVYQSIRALRVKGVGVHVTKDGYILSEFASKSQDVNFLRRLNGRRTSDIIAIQASERHIKHRWNTVEDKRNIQLILSPLNGSVVAAQRGLKILLTKSNSLGI